MSTLEIKTPLLRQADQYTIGEYEALAVSDFSYHVVNLYNKLKEQNSDLYSIGLYKQFEYEECKNKFHINTKNINYESTLTDVRQQLAKEVYPIKLDCSGETKLKKVIQCVNSIPNWEELFGKGEFPFLVIRVFRLGNTEYFCYSITR